MSSIEITGLSASAKFCRFLALTFDVSWPQETRESIQNTTNEALGNFVPASDAGCSLAKCIKRTLRDGNILQSFNHTAP